MIDPQHIQLYFKKFTGLWFWVGFGQIRLCRQINYSSVIIGILVPLIIEFWICKTHISATL